MNIPDRASAIVGWRAWRVWVHREEARMGWQWWRETERYPKDAELRGIAQGWRWPKGTPAHSTCMARYHDAPDPEWAAIMRDAHRSPVEGCSCGLYALKSPRRARAECSGYPSPDGYAYGKVALWGNVIEGTDGYRAESAYPLELYLPPDVWGYRHFLKDYGVPLFPLPLYEQTEEWKNDTYDAQAAQAAQVAVAAHAFFPSVTSTHTQQLYQLTATPPWTKTGWFG